MGFPGPRPLISDEKDDIPIHEMMRRPVERGPKRGTRPAGPGGAGRRATGRSRPGGIPLPYLRGLAVEMMGKVLGEEE